jgi:hypothetical protein
MKNIIFFVIAACFGFSVSAFAADVSNYAGASLNLTSIKTNTATERGIGVDALIGHNFNKYVGLEGGVGAVNIGNNTIDGIHFSGAVVGNLPLTDAGIGLYAKYGYAYSQLGNSTTGASTGGSGPTYGGGVAFTSSSVIVRVGYEAYDYSSIASNYKGDGFVLQMMNLF